MFAFRVVATLCVAAASFCSLAQYGTPATLKAELTSGDDLTFSREAKELGMFTEIANTVLLPTTKSASKMPALIVLPACAGITKQTRFWVEEALKEGYAALPVSSLRGHPRDCGSPPLISNARYVKDALDAIAHVAAMPMVDAERIFVVGFSKGANTVHWLASSAVADAVRPGTPKYAGVVSVYGLCRLPPNRARPEGIVLLQQDTTDRPLLLLMGGQDNETPPAACLEVLPKMKAAGRPVQWHLYENATHSWDAADLDGFTKTAFNGQVVTYRFDKAVTQDTRKRVFEFIGQLGK